MIIRTNVRIEGNWHTRRQGKAATADLAPHGPRALATSGFAWSRGTDTSICDLLGVNRRTTAGASFIACLSFRSSSVDKVPVDLAPGLCRLGSRVVSTWLQGCGNNEFVASERWLRLRSS